MLFFWTRLNILIFLSILDWKYSWIILNDKLWAYGISALECVGVSGNYQCSCRLDKGGIFLWLSFKHKLYCIYILSAQNWVLFKIISLDILIAKKKCSKYNIQKFIMLFLQQGKLHVRKKRLFSMSAKIKMQGWICNSKKARRD